MSLARRSMEGLIVRYRAQTAGSFGLAFGFLAVVALMLSPAWVLTRTLTVPDEYSTIGEAMAVAGPGDVVFVGPGRYLENVVMAEETTLLGAGRSLTLIDGGESPAVFCGRGCTVAQLGLVSRSSVATVIARNVSCTIKESDITGRGNGIYCQGGSVKIVRNRLFENFYSGMLAEGCDVYVEQNVAFLNDLDGIRCIGSDAEIVANESFGNAHAGINCRDGTFARVEGNFCHDNNHSGIFCIRSSAEVVANRTELNAQMGFQAVSSLGVLLAANQIVANHERGVRFASGSGLIVGNRIERNKFSGVWLVQGSQTDILGNVIERNYGHGILIEEGSVAVVSDNLLLRNYTSGVCIQSGASALISSNSIIDSRFDGIYAEGVTDATIERNILLRNHFMGISSESANLAVRNNLFIRNFFDAIRSVASSMQIINNTFYQTELAAVRWEQSGRHLIQNNIFVGGQQAVFAPQYVVPPQLSISYNDVWEIGKEAYARGDGSEAFAPSPGTGCFSEAPRFVSEMEFDFHLQDDSPCIDAGCPEDEARDLDGSVNDVGAYGGPFAGRVGASPIVWPVLDGYDYSPGEEIALSVTVGNEGEPAEVELFLLVRGEGFEAFYPDWSSTPSTVWARLPEGFWWTGTVAIVEAADVSRGRFEVVAGAVEPESMQVIGQPGRAVFRVVSHKPPEAGPGLARRFDRKSTE